MSRVEQARRTTAEIAFDGVNITSSIRPYLLSVTYTDNEEDETDDLQLRIQDRDNVWMCKWLNDAIQAAAATAEVPTANKASSKSYTVTAKSGLNVRSGPGTSHGRLGTLAYGTVVDVSSISNGWAKIQYSGKTAYISAGYIAQGSSSGITSTWNIGDSVIANGRPQYTSYGNGTPGKNVTNYRGNITHLNLKSGVPYPIHVGNLGWFAESQITKATSTEAGGSSGTKGLRIQAVIVRENWTGDGKDLILDCGQFALDSIDASGPPAVITIKGTSLPYSSQIRQTKKSKAWESYTLSGLANEMAASNGMTCLYLAANVPFYERVEQYNTSDINFLSTLCHNAGISLKATNNVLVLFDQASYEAKSAVLTIKRGDGTYTKYKLSVGQADIQYSSCRVSYVNPSTGKCIQAIAYVEEYKSDSKKNQQLEVKAKVSSIAEAKDLAEKRLRLHNKYERTATFTLPGNPNLAAGVTVFLSGWGAWDGKYIAKQAKHSVTDSGYTVQVQLRRVLEGY
ncbi:SH3 domain-containing protein [Anaeromassilibacillus senegalensis]|uniref:SH3 domain-containing protein n=1 Tax=Anaeromassilibacillus senegalensis TaxID=1673717 RepID=UPI0006835504|nr:SH3 domain-containing protein [Anaeromassilibacillus senegalensis]